MVGIGRWNTIFVLIAILENSWASTHWIVTENGRIQAQVDSAFHLRRPYDLLALLEQENRVQTIDNLYQELVSRKTSIDYQWSSLQGATDLETRLYSEDVDCVRAGRQVPDVDLFEKHFGDLNKRIRLEKYLSAEEVSENDPKEPDCINAVPLDFSMHAFEHLNALLDRVNLSTDPQPSLFSVLGIHSEVTEFGKQVAHALQKNNTSWFHHNLAALYWRIQGDGFKAAECARRAIHYSPRHYRDLPLLTLGELLFQAHRPAEAAIVLHAAVDHAPNTPLSHLALGNVYAELGDYNRSLACYENALKLQPALEEVTFRRYSALCHLKLERGLLELHESLQGIVTELHEYHSKHKLWLKHQEDLMWQQAPLEVRLLNSNQQFTSTIVENRGQSCVQKVLDGQTVLSCDVNNDNHLLAQSITLSLQMLLKSVESQAKLISEHVTIRSPQIYQHEKRVSATSKVDPSPSPNMSQTQDEKDNSARTRAVFEQDGWPSKSECAAFNGKFPPSNGIPSMYLPPESRGFQVHLYLSQLIDLPVDTEHALPWYPPVCTEQQKEQDITLGHNQGFAPETDLKPQLLKYGDERHSVEAEIGQRILTAITKGVGPKWLLHTLGSLYWRIKGNPRNALACLQVALDSCPWQFRDIVLISQGAVLHRLGQIDEALVAITEALSIKSDEPISNFLMATLLNAKGNYSGATFHLLQTLIKAPNYLNGLALDFLRHTSCQQKYGLHDTSTPTTPNPEEMCGAANVKSGDILSNLGETVLCSPDGEQCRAVQCFSTNQGPGVGNMVMLEPSSVQQLLSTGSEAECGSASNLHSGHKHNMWTAQMDQSKQLHLRISLGEDVSSHNFPPLGDFIVSLSDEPAPDAWLNVYDKSGTYPLSPNQCKRLRKINWDEHMGQWLSSSAPATIRLQEHLPQMFQRKYEAKVEPHCDSSVPTSSDSLDYLEGVKLRNRLQLSPEIALAPWLSVIIGADGSSTQELGILLALALQENATSWALATVAALYWRIVGHAEEAINCIRQALQYAPSSSKKFPLTSLASILHRAGFYDDALAVATMALELSPTFEMAHFTIANIHAAMGDLDKAISHYRSSLTIQPEMEPARNRLQFILCLLLFEENGTKSNL